MKHSLFLPFILTVQVVSAKVVAVVYDTETNVPLRVIVSDDDNSPALATGKNEGVAMLDPKEYEGLDHAGFIQKFEEVAKITVPPVKDFAVLDAQGNVEKVFKTRDVKFQDPEGKVVVQIDGAEIGGKVVGDIYVEPVKNVIPPPPHNPVLVEPSIEVLPE